MAEAAPVIAIVAAVAENGVIGRNGRLPWRIPSEMRHFRRITMGKPVIMGRKTFASLKKPLEGRDNIVLTRQEDFQVQGGIVAATVEDALRIARDHCRKRGVDEAMVIGGADVYAAILPYAERFYLTRVHARPEGSVYFPEGALEGWSEMERVHHPAERGDEFAYTMSRLSRAPLRVIEY